MYYILVLTCNIIECRPPPIPGQKPAVTHRNFWYGFDYGAVHFTVMSSEQDFLPGSEQYQWLLTDLANVDRQKTPWLLFLSHRPFYTSEGDWRHPDRLVYLILLFDVSQNHTP
jgi:hypothetical protein